MRNWMVPPGFCATPTPATMHPLSCTRTAHTSACGTAAEFSAFLESKAMSSVACGFRLAIVWSFSRTATEASDASGEEFGEARLLSLLERSRALRAGAIQEKIIGAISE